MNLSNLTPQQQSLIFNALKAQGQQPAGGGLSPDTQDPQAQQGTGAVDSGGLAQLFQQPGDKVHPADAMQQIAQQLLPGQTDAPVQGDANGPAAPAGINLATGPKLSAGPNGSLRVPLGRGSLLGLLGMKQTVSAGANYYQAAKDNGLLKYSPGALAQMPDGTPFVGPESYQKMLETHKILFGQGNQVFSTVDQLTSQGVPEDTARKMLAANPTGVTGKEITNSMGRERIDIQGQIADARATMAGVAKMGQILKVGGFDAAQEAAKKAVANLGFAQRAQAAIDQITANGGIADQRQRAELATSVAGLVGNGASVVTDEKMNQFLPTSAKGKFANVVEYWTNERQPVNFTGYLPQMQDLLTREVQANKGISDGAQKLGIDIYGQSNPKTAKMLNTVRAQNPLVGNPPPTQPAPPATVSQPTAVKPPAVKKVLPGLVTH